jgi:tetratricopeptide (TPR) repeat protein
MKLSTALLCDASFLIHVDNRFRRPLGVTFNCSDNIVKSFPVYPPLISCFSREMGNCQGERADLGNLGSVYINLRQVDKATECYEQALVIVKEIKDPRSINFCEDNLNSIVSTSNLKRSKGFA